MPSSPHPLLLFPPPNLLSSAGETIVKTISSGSIRCNQDASTNTISCKGVPYGESTAGTNRFLPPKPRSSWNYTLDTLKWGAGCISTRSGVDVAPIQSEDCLNLNVFAPIKPRNNRQRLPVMVFFYGGAFQEGMAEGPFELYDGTWYAGQHDVVFVTVNYRLGAFGFLVTDKITGNAGILDQRLALRWVQANAHVFGGDATQVTLFGESAGAMSTGLHLLSPGSQGLFKNAILQSNPVGLRYMTNDRAVLFGYEFCRLLNCMTRDGCDTKCIQSVTSESVGAAAKTSSGNMTVYIAANYDHLLDGILGYKPTLDGKDFPGQAIATLDAGKYNKSIAIMVGATSHEAIPFVAPSKTPEPIPMSLFEVAIPLMFGDKRGKILNSYYAPRFNEALEAVIAVLSDVLFKCSAQKFSTAAATAGAPSYFYRFDHIFSAADLWTNFGFPELCRTRVCHTAELPFVFHKTNLDVPEVKINMTIPERNLSEQMVRYWTNFAYTSDPNIAWDGSTESLQWPKFKPSERQGIRFEAGKTNTESTSELCAMWDTVGYDILVSGVKQSFDLFENYQTLRKMKAQRSADFN